MTLFGVFCCQNGILWHVFNVPKKKPNSSEKEIVRVTFRFHGPELGQIREVRDMLSLNSEVDAARYLIQRGLETMSSTLTNRRMQTEIVKKVSAEELIKAMFAAGYVPAEGPPPP
jgi:ribosomal protein S12